MDLYAEIINGNNNALSKGITLVESTLEEHKIISQELVMKCSEKNYNSIRIGVTGVPGVGKSTFIEKFGIRFTKNDKKVAVLAIDPSSEETKGSILGDKSRMNELSNNKNVFIRPSSNSGILGGVSNKTRDCIILCEAAGYDIIIIETVGVGQSETVVSKLVDVMLLLALTGAGDKLQGIKRGIIELANIIIITKDDGDNKNKVKTTMLDFHNTLILGMSNEISINQKILRCSAKENTGVFEVKKAVEIYINNIKENKKFNVKRQKQNIYWINKFIKEELGNIKYNELLNKNLMKDIEHKIINNKENVYELIKKI